MKPYDILAAGEINPDLVLTGDVVPAFGQVENSLSTRKAGGTTALPSLDEAMQYVGCASLTGKVSKVKVLTFKGTANRNDPKSCAWDSNGPGEALIGERAGQENELRNAAYTSECRRDPTIRKATCGQSLCETGSNSAQSKTLYMPGNTLHGNWESLRLPGDNMPGCIGKSKDVSQ